MICSAVDVAEAVDVEMVKSGAVPADIPAIENCPHGVVEESPRKLFVSSKKKLALSSVTAEPDVKSTEPAVNPDGVSESVRNVPAPPTHVPFTEKQPSVMLRPFANVLVAEVEVMLRAFASSPHAMVEVAEVLVALNWSTARMFPMISPATESLTEGDDVPIPTLFVEKSYTNPDVSIARPPEIVDVAVVEVAVKYGDSMYEPVCKLFAHRLASVDVAEPVVM